ncbi:MAG: aminopeptidase P N-terminal domain-containing protein [Gemmatimonadaceae bacterium]|nr:aminopeptidase P N-terminal domain-containing protein [Gemmatimonadaceae bacterium]
MSLLHVHQMLRRASRGVALLVAIVVGAPAAAQIPAAEYAARRATILDDAGDGIVLVLGAGEPPENYSSFWQTPHADWLTGIREPGMALVMVRRGAMRAQWLLVEPKNPDAEVWTGRRLGERDAARRTGLATRPASDLDRLVDSLLAAGSGPLRVVRHRSEGGELVWRDQRRLDAIVQRHPGLTLDDADALITRRRGRKSAAELALLRRSIDITVEAHREIASRIAPGVYEYEVQALLEYTFRRRGADRPSFASIVGSGPNSTILHYNTNERQMLAGETVVVDIGSSFQGYAADVTRTYPVSGTFRPDARAVYDIVRRAQAAAEAAATPGANAALMSRSADSVLAAGLTALGLIDAPGAMYDCGSADAPRRCRQLRLFYMHGLGHGIGLDVHDPDQYYDTGVLAEGSAFTIEPGLYVRADVLASLPDTPGNRAFVERRRAAVARYADIGVRIEDDYVVTAAGVEWVSRLPREANEIEALMAARRGR